MQLARFLVEAVVLGKQSPNQLVREHPISRSWFYELLARYRRDGPAALEPRSHRPWRSLRSITASAATASMPAAASLSAISAGCATSKSATSTAVSKSCYWSRATPCASSPKTALCCAN